MSALERELLERFNHLDAERQQWVLDFVRKIENTAPKRVYSSLELMKLPLAEREAYIKAAFEAASDEDFETFEA